MLEPCTSSDGKLCEQGARSWEGSHGLEASRTSQSVRTTHRSAVIGNTGSGGEGVDKKVVVVTSDIPHGEPEQVVLDDEISLGSERPRVVVGNHQLLGLVIKVRLRE